MRNNPNHVGKRRSVLRALIEIAFIVFLFYSNLLMGQYTVSGLGQTNGLLWAIQNVFTPANFLIAIVTALIGHLVFEFFRKRV